MATWNLPGTWDLAATLEKQNRNVHHESIKLTIKGPFTPAFKIARRATFAATD
jgi:hypothetical protein